MDDSIHHNVIHFDFYVSSFDSCFFFVSISSIVPSKPLNLTVLEVTSTTITIGWRDPENLNGAIVGYRVFYIHQNQTYFATVRSGTAAGEMIRYDLCDLSKFQHLRTLTHECSAHCSHIQTIQLETKFLSYLS